MCVCVHVRASLCVCIAIYDIKPKIEAFPNRSVYLFRVETEYTFNIIY